MPNETKNTNQTLAAIKCGYVMCACCGYDTVASDTSKPTLCSSCEEAGCEIGGDGCRCFEGTEEGSGND